MVEVEIRHGDVSGFGEAAPIERYHESAESALSFVESVAGELGDDPFALDDVMKRLPDDEFAARAAIDAALHDLGGKLLGEPVWRMLGLERLGPPTSWTIGLGAPDEMREKAAKAHASGRFRRLKLKLGGGDGLDVDRVRAVREATDVPLQVDVNEWWTLDEALDALPQLGELGVEYCEQPLAAGSPDGAKLKAASPVPIYVDEDCHTLRDVAACVPIAHGINIKLAKSGGIREAILMAHAARAAAARRDARLHGRDRPRDRRRRGDGQPLRPCRPRREPPDRVRPMAGHRARRRDPDPLRGARAWRPPSGT